MRDALIIGVTVGVFAMLGNVGGFVVAHKLSGVAAQSSAEVAMGRLRRDPSLRSE